jgi:hypothetical protein
MSLTEHEKWKVHHKIDAILSIILLICLIYLLPIIFFICKAFFRGQTYLPEMQNWLNFILRMSNDFWLGIIKRIFG